jgi:hypothetical protein
MVRVRVRVRDKVRVWVGTTLVESRGMGSWIARGEENGAAAMCEARLMSGQAIREDLTHPARTCGRAGQAATTRGLSGGWWLGGLWKLVHIAHSCSVWCCQKARRPGYARL